MQAWIFGVPGICASGARLGPWPSRTPQSAALTAPLCNKSPYAASGNGLYTFQVSLCRYVFARVFSVSVLRAALIHRCGGPPSPMGKVIGLRPGVYEFARGSPHRFCVPMFLWCDCHWQSFIWNSLRGAPPLIRRLWAAPSPEGKVF